MVFFRRHRKRAVFLAISERTMRSLDLTLMKKNMMLHRLRIMEKRCTAPCAARFIMVA